MAAIVYLKPEQLEEHPDNPRKSIGDITELCASIQKQGLLQNLTVVPHPGHPGKWRIVIGHRRFNAAKAAGLSELPCVIDDKMSYAEQIAVMMSENMQRNDLTINERVGGVQMMMDLGIDIKGISESTGLSQTSVRRYAKLAKIQSGIDKAEQQGATLMQLAEIAEIEFPDLQAEALKNAGTGEYVRTMFTVKFRRIRNERQPVLVEIAKTIGEELTKKSISYNEWNWVQAFRYMNDGVVQEIKDFAAQKKASDDYGYQITENSVDFYKRIRRIDKQEEAKKAELRNIWRLRSQKELGLAKEFRFMRRLYMSDINIKGKETGALRFILFAEARGGYRDQVSIHGEFFKAFLDGKERVEKESYTSAVALTCQEAEEIPEKHLLLGALLAAYDSMDYTDVAMIDSYTGKRKPENYTRNVRDLYCMMKLIGYEPCQEEQEWLDGTHPIYEWQPEGDADKKEDA